MIGSSFIGSLPDPLRVVVVGAHADDIEIGCGGTILRLAAERRVDVTWVVLTAPDLRSQEARRGAEAFLDAADRSEVVVCDFRDGYLPHGATPVKELFDDLGRRLDPHLVLTHTRSDLHQDHRLVCELTWNTWRSHMILEYEIPKYDGDLGTPNLFVSLTAEQLQRKLDLLFDVYMSQQSKPWFTRELLGALPLFRGMEARSPTGLAEAFTCRKITI